MKHNFKTWYASAFNRGCSLFFPQQPAIMTQHLLLQGTAGSIRPSLCFFIRYASIFHRKWAFYTACHFCCHDLTELDSLADGGGNERFVLLTQVREPAFVVCAIADRKGSFLLTYVLHFPTCKKWTGRVICQVS
jgi:hypothetical protein